MASRSIALAFASVLAVAAPAFAQQPGKPAPSAPAPSAPGRDAARPQATAPAEFEREIEAACYRRIDRADFAQRLARLREAAGDGAALYAGAPGVFVAAARFARERDDFAAALRDYDGLLASLPAADARRQAIARERAIAAEEQALVAGGNARPAGGWLLTALADAPGPDGAAYRVGIWVRPECSPFGIGEGESALQLYRPTGATPSLARAGDLVRAAEGSALAVNDDATGSELTGDGRRVLAVDEANGGNCAGCSRLRLFVARADGLAELRIEAPPFVVPQGVETIAEGRRVVLGIDARWEMFGGVCRACSPGVFVTFAWAGDRFTPSCRAVADYYRRQAREAASQPGTTAEDRFGSATSILLARTQAGDGDQAWKDYRNALAELRRLPRTRRNAYAQAERQLAAAYRAGAAAMAAASCPVNALPLAAPRRR